MRKIQYSILCFIILLLSIPALTNASGLSLTVTPALFEMSAVPEQAWNSSVKVINNNPQELTVYANVVNFQPQGENGHGKFLPVFEDFTEGKTLAEWITVSDQPYVIPPEKSISIPINVRIPADASPGGHFAAIMVGTKPPDSQGSPLQIQTSQIVTSLFFVRVAGDVVENGVVRTFRTSDSFLDTPEAEFVVRFENKGNVHLQPQGEIKITNMWGKERGVIPINHQTHFGNVLPNSIRKFTFTWKGERSLKDIGRYTATLTLAYGTDERKFVTRSTSFWVVPVKSVALVLLSIVLIILLVGWSIRAYVRRMLALSVTQGYIPPAQRVRSERDIVIGSRVSVSAPIKGGIKDFKAHIEKAKRIMGKVRAICTFALLYKKFFISFALLVVAGVVVWQFLADVTTSARDFEVTIENPDASVTLSSEEIIYEDTDRIEEITQEATVSNIGREQDYNLQLINSSDHVGMAASLRKELEAKGYTVHALQSDFSEPKQRTVIVYDVSVQEAALELSKEMKQALLSARPLTDATTTASISIFIGNDYQPIETVQ